MADHNGDYSPEAERARQLKREKMQRRRIRERIREGRATDLEIEAMDIWDEGSEAWEAIARAMTGVTPAAREQVAQARPPRTPRARKVAQVAQEEKPGSSPLWIAGGLVTAFLCAVLWIGKNAGG